MYHQPSPAMVRHWRGRLRLRTVKSDRELQQDVAAEVAWDPSVDEARIVIEAHDGTVTLVGQVHSHAQKWRAEAAVLRVGGVKGMVSRLAVDLPDRDKRPDAEIARAAHQALAWNALVPAGKVQATVEDGWVTLSGDVEWEYQSSAAEVALRSLTGIRGLLNLIQVKPRIEPRDVTHQVEAALRRCSGDPLRPVAVVVNGGTVTLSGEVASWRERYAIRRAAWAAPGVRNVVDQTTIKG